MQKSTALLKLKKPKPKEAFGETPRAITPEIYSFNGLYKNASQNVSCSLEKLITGSRPIVVLCVGSDLVLGDSLGPLVGTFLRKKNIPANVYGTLDFPITAKEVEYAKKYLKKFHPESSVIAIDAAVGNLEDVGVIRVMSGGLKPGLGVNKNLKSVGDTSIIAVVAPKEENSLPLLNLTRLKLIFTLAEQIANGIEGYLTSTSSHTAQLF